MGLQNDEICIICSFVSSLIEPPSIFAIWARLEKFITFVRMYIYIVTPQRMGTYVLQDRYQSMYR